MPVTFFLLLDATVAIFAFWHQVEEPTSASLHNHNQRSELNSYGTSDFFKSRAIDERNKIAEAMLKDKHTRIEQQKLREQAMAMLREHGEPMPAKIKDYPAPAMKKLYEWKLNKKTTEAREKLLKAYLSAPVPKKDPEWTVSEEIRIKRVLQHRIWISLQKTINEDLCS